MKTTIQKLREDGNKVRVRHCRAYKNIPGEYLTRRQFEERIESSSAISAAAVINGKLSPKPYSEIVSPNGGMTVVQITTPTGEELEGVALCSLKDGYCRKKGLAIAMGRALIGK